MIYDDLLSGKKKMAVIGLGYVGLPIALEFAKKISVIGFDIKSERVEMMKNKVDPSNELSSEDFEGCDIKFTASIDELPLMNTRILISPRYFLQQPLLEKCCLRETMWFTNQLYIPDVPRRTAFPCSVRYLASSSWNNSKWDSHLSGSILAIGNILSHESPRSLRVVIPNRPKR